MKEYISLSELNGKIKEKIEKDFSLNFRITAEISEFRESRGHAYLELSEKSEDDTVLAKARATVWARTYGMLKSYFESSTGHKLEAGLKVLLVVQVVFHEVYGFSLNVIDIDPTYTIGEIERKKMLIIRRLEEEGVIDMNKETDFPPVPQRIAVISSDTAAGFGDFKNQLLKSAFKFDLKLFPAAMQGEETENTIIEALERIYEEEENFDVVVIIRGGGSKSDLSWFDSYKIAVNIAQFPLPVLTGIGHERDLSISDLTAYRSLNTPTAVAEFLIDKVSEFYSFLEKLSNNFYDITEDILYEKKNKLNEISTRFKYIFYRVVSDQKNNLKLVQSEFGSTVKQKLEKNAVLLRQYPYKILNVAHSVLNTKMQMNELYNLRMNNTANKFVDKEMHKIEMFDQKIRLTDPKHVLKSGYSYTLHEGKLLKSVKNIREDEILETVLSDGKIKSKVVK